MGGLVSYFSRSWRGSESDSIQDLVGSSASHHVTETSLTNPDFNVKRSSSSELVTLPPSSQSNDSPTTEVKQLTDKDDQTDGGVVVNNDDDGSDDQTDGGGVDDNDNDLDGLFPDRLIDVTPLEEGERYKEINNIMKAVLQLYKPISLRKTGIKESLKQFKSELGLKSKYTFSQCFSVLRAQVHNESRIELLCAGTEPIKIKIDELSDKTTSENVKRAVMFLNSALTTCQKFNGEKELKLADIQYKLEDLHLMPLTKEGLDLYNSINSIPSYVEEMSTDIERLHQQLYEARLLLRPK